MAQHFILLQVNPSATFRLARNQNGGYLLVYIYEISKEYISEIPIENIYVEINCR